MSAPVDTVLPLNRTRTRPSTSSNQPSRRPIRPRSLGLVNACGSDDDAPVGDEARPHPEHRIATPRRIGFGSPQPIVTLRYL